VGAHVTDDIVPFFDLRSQVTSYRDELRVALDRVIDSGYFIGGASVDEFEAAWAAYCGTSQCVGVGNGLDAIRLILEGYGIGPGDEVIVPGFTYYASWLGVQQVGATIVPVDCELETAAIDPSRVEAAITPATKAVLAVHLYGIPADMAALRALTDAAGILLIEDAAQAHGASTTAGKAGAAGHAAAFSFYPTKNLGALGDAGGVTTDDPALASRLRSRRSYGQGREKYEHVDTGWNSRLDPIQAAFLMVHLARLDEWTERRRAIAASYREALADAAAATVGPAAIDGSVWHHFVLRAPDRAALRAALAAAGVATDVHYPYSIRDIEPLRPLVRYVDDQLSRSAQLGAQVVSLPMGPWMTDSQVDHVAGALRTLDRGLLAL
jgi:dTDP-3-amino-3,4,6-trideoxy-alpha-D-glucose transaminase